MTNGNGTNADRLIQTQAQLIAEADRVGFDAAGRILKLLAVLRSHPNLNEPRIQFVGLDKTITRGPRVLDQLLCELLDSTQSGFRRIKKLEMTVGDMQTKLDELHNWRHGDEIVEQVTRIAQSMNDRDGRR